MNEIATNDISTIKAELDALRLEKEILSTEVKRLVQAEGKLYAHQEQLDSQLKEYQQLYELNRKLCATSDLSVVFEHASAYVINSLGYERVVFFRQSAQTGDYAVCALDGYYDRQEKQAVLALTISQQDTLLSPLLGGAEFRICGEGCQDPGLLAYREKMHLGHYQLYVLGSQARPVAFLAVGNTVENAQFYRRVSDSEGAPLGIGNLVGLLSSAIENQTLYASMEKALEQERLAEAKYRGIFENAMEGMYQATPDGNFLSCNPATAAILGYDTPQEVVESINGIGHQLYVNPLCREELFETLRSGSEVKDFEAQFYRKDGSSQWVRLSARPCFNEKSELICIDVILQDIAEHKRTEETLIKLSQAVEQSPVTIVITDTQGLIEFVNPKFVQLTGYTLEEAIGKKPSVLKSESSSPETHLKLWDTITAGNVWEGEFSNRKKNGELFSERATISPIKNKDGVTTHYLAIKEDITERKQLEAQLLQSQKMESIGRLAGGVAHDFNNMLSVIIGCAQLAMLKVPEGDKAWQYLNQISKAAERSSDITRQLLAFSRKEIISLKKMNLNAKIIETQTTLGRLIGEDINLTFKPVTNIWTIEADPSQLDQILVNLAVNARDAMPGGGYLAIETANIHIDRTYCHYHLDSKPGDYVQLIVSDSGSGMDKQTLAHIFEPFFTTKEVGKGTGLGLATVYGIVRQNNGFINVYSEPGQGTSFQFHFPRLLGAAETESRPAALEISGSGTVLLVEDDPLVREMALQMLDEIGYTVVQAENPRDAIEICKKGEVPIDIILTDVVMPGMNGKEMVDNIESFRPSLKVLFMSGYTSDLVAQRGVVDQGRYFIQKPFDMHSLNEKIKATLLDEQRSSS
jgi:two-component system, cell cycle sensor histidine kinase and response regulator CckA